MFADQREPLGLELKHAIAGLPVTCFCRFLLAVLCQSALPFEAAYFTISINRFSAYLTSGVKHTLGSVSASESIQNLRQKLLRAIAVGIGEKLLRCGFFHN